MAERGLCLELMRSMFLLATMPFSLSKSICLFCMRIVFLAAYTWILLVKAIIIFQVDVCYKALIWTLGVVSLPLRILNALQRERLVSLTAHFPTMFLGSCK
ncbi:hypothetical protein NE237_000045 [Protea cynaroides]|uniref:Uncharacterized protein n=1 Tax=Protea cynaroides TaxID=273540 RepID=A0A9Q0GM38_9MAGN|nr:hypothetical protein NE237_000045 [Protea cynaroides]